MLPPKRFSHFLESLLMGGLALGPLVTKCPEVFGIQPILSNPCLLGRRENSSELLGLHQHPSESFVALVLPSCLTDM